MLMKRLVLTDIKLTLRHNVETMAALLFFIIAGTLFAFAIGPNLKTLTEIAPGVVWVTALLAALLPLERLFGPDFEDGTLDLLLLSGRPTYEIALAKAATHWLTTGLPLLIIAAPVAIMLHLPASRLPPLMLSLLPGTLVFSLIGTFAAALTLGAQRGATLLPLITLPLLIPALIFGTAAATSLHPSAAFYMIFALLLATLPLAPWGTATALRAASE